MLEHALLLYRVERLLNGFVCLHVLALLLLGVDSLDLDREGQLVLGVGLLLLGGGVAQGGRLLTYDGLSPVFELIKLFMLVFDEFWRLWALDHAIAALMHAHCDTEGDIRQLKLVQRSEKDG